MNITLNTQKMLLSGSRRVYKTEGFIAMTRRIVSVDALISRVAESLFYADIRTANKCYRVQTQDGAYTLYFCANVNDERLNGGDVIFYKFITTHPDEGGTDRRLTAFLGESKTVELALEQTDEVATEQDLSRIYLVSGGDGVVNFPLLNTTQRKIVETEDANMLVQGVAGSGKTNVCVEKIVYCAARGYRGKVLYTTFSRGLLSETRNRVNLFLRNIEQFIEFYSAGKVVFLDEHHKKAIENKLGILFDTDDDAKIVESLKRIAAFLKNNVDYMLIEDIYAAHFEKKGVAGESVFLNQYTGDKNYRLSGALERIKHIAPEIIYKEIYGMIFGKYEMDAPKKMMGRDEYIEARRDSFSKTECEQIYAIAADYITYLEKNNLTDNNLMSRALIEKLTSPLYSVGIIDEAQDFTQVNLCLIKKLCIKLFCVGDALQMINPAYFNFGYLKRLMYGDVTGVSELKHNYRSSEKIERIAEKLGEMNIRRFGTHSFVLKGESVKSAISSSAIFVKDKDFATMLGDKKFENVTVVVSSQRKKEQLRQHLGKMEILTVAEAKGLERNTVILCDVLSDNIENWNFLLGIALDRKTADENSVFRYFFNLFYVGISRAKQYLFVCERTYPKIFEELFDSCFEKKSRDAALSFLKGIAGKIEIDDDELIDRIQKFCALEQYENARYTADRLSVDSLRETQLAHIYVHENYLRYGRIRDAGIEYWKRGMDADAREMFTQSGDEQLFPLMDACLKGGGALDVDIVRFLPLVEDNEVATRLIMDTVKSDLDEVVKRQKQINEKLSVKRKRQ